MDAKTKTKKNKTKFLRALKKARGMVTTAAIASKLSKSNHYVWYNEDPEYKLAVDEINEVIIDSVENRLMGLIDNDNTSAIMFYLKNKCSDYKPTLAVDVEGQITVAPIKIIKPDSNES